MQNKKPFEIILHPGRVTSLQSWVAKKSCQGQTLLNECSISDYPYNFELPCNFLFGREQGKSFAILHYFQWTEDGQGFRSNT